MKKIFLTLIVIINLYLSVNADVLPYYSNSLRRYGIGYTKVQSPLVMKREAKDDGEVLEKLNFDFKGNVFCEINKDRCQIEEVFSAYSKDKKIALMTTLDETQDWTLVCFNQQERPVCGWIKMDENKFYNWSDFFGELGKKYGIYFFKDVQKTDKIMYAAPMKQTNSVGSVELPKSVFPWLVRGNWILVKVHDLNNQFKTGWINFRDDFGKLKVFVKL